MNKFESAILKLIDEQLLIDEAVPLSDSFFDRINELKKKASQSKINELDFDIWELDKPITLLQVQEVDGWRLPTSNEMFEIYNIQREFNNKRYWIRLDLTVDKIGHLWYGWYYDFANGRIDFNGKSQRYHVMLIKYKTEIVG